MLKKSFLLSLVALGITGCGGPEPVTGKVEGNGHQVAIVSNAGAVYEVDKAKFTAWKKLDEDNAQLPEAKEELLKLRAEYAGAKLVQERFSDNQYLSQKDFNFDDYVKDIDETGGKFMDDLEKEEAKSRAYINKMKDQKATSDAAEAKLEAIKRELQSELRALEDSFNTPRKKAATYFGQFDHKEFRVRDELIEAAAYDGRYGYKSSKRDIADCREYVLSKQFGSSSHAESWVYGEQWQHNGRNYCPYYEMPGYSADDKARLKGQLPDAAINELRTAANAYIRAVKLDNDLERDIAHVKQNHPELVEQKEAFSFSESRKYNRAERTIEHVEERKERLLATPADVIQANELKQLREELYKAKPFFVLSELYAALEKVSDIQPDGTFNVETSNNYFLLVDMAEKPHPRSTQAAVIRVGEDSTKPVTINGDDFFAYRSLSKVNFQ